jgi:dTDP-4-dehydrorhamnose reductase
VAKLLVTGAGGMLGQAVAAAAEKSSDQTLTLGRDKLDITDAAAVTAAIDQFEPDAVINCAAWTDVDGAETEEAAATEINGAGAANLAASCEASGGRLIHVSTDYVFDGAATEPYLESDPVSPQSAYGRSKLAGEQAIEACGGDYAIVRTAWLFGAGGSNFVGTMLRLGDEREQIEVVTDQIGCPTWTGHLATALVTCAAADGTGIFHAVGGGRCSWFDLASETISLAGLDCKVQPTTTESFPRPAPRPAFSVLGSERGGAAIVLPDWHEGLRGYLAAAGVIDSAAGAAQGA